MPKLRSQSDQELPLLDLMTNDRLESISTSVICTSTCVVCTTRGRRSSWFQRISAVVDLQARNGVAGTCKTSRHPSSWFAPQVRGVRPHRAWVLTRCGIGSSGSRCPRAMSVLASRSAGCCRPRRAVRSSSSSGMTPRRGFQRASFGRNARGNEECRADTIGLAPVGRPKSTVGMLLSPAPPEPPGQATRDIVRGQS